MDERAVTLVVSLPVDGEDGDGTLEELDFRHDLEDVLDAALRQRRLGRVDGGGQGGGYQDVFMVVHRESWRAAWEVVRAKLAEQGLLGRASATISLEGGQPARELWPPSDESPQP
jgi:hypothetical protein